jgi:hypothetical protein
VSLSLRSLLIGIACLRHSPRLLAVEAADHPSGLHLLAIVPTAFGGTAVRFEDDFDRHHFPLSIVAPAGSARFGRRGKASGEFTPQCFIGW